MYHILVTSGVTECIIHFNLASCNRVCVCVCVYRGHWECAFSWSKCFGVCVCVLANERELAHLCNNLGLDVSGHFYKC